MSIRPVAAQPAQSRAALPRNAQVPGLDYFSASPADAGHAARAPETALDQMFAYFG